MDCHQNTGNLGAIRWLAPTGVSGSLAPAIAWIRHRGPCPTGAQPRPSRGLPGSDPKRPPATPHHATPTARLAGALGRTAATNDSRSQRPLDLPTSGVARRAAAAPP